MDGVPTPDGGRANIATVWSDSWLRSACNSAVHAFITDTQATVLAAGLEHLNVVVCARPGNPGRGGGPVLHTSAGLFMWGHLQVDFFFHQTLQIS